MITFEKVSKSYHDFHALTNINCHIDKGEMVFLTGHSGAGKTTFLKLITRIESVSKGQIFVNDRNILRLRDRQIPYFRRQIGMVFQNPHLLTKQTIFQNVALPLIISGFRYTEIKRRVHAALDKVGLLSKKKYYPMALSVGEQQRVGIARAIVNRPLILLADEPTGNLDPDLSSDIMDLFSAFNAVGVTVIIATHDLALIAPLNHRVLTLKSGQLTQPGTPYA